MELSLCLFKESDMTKNFWGLTVKHTQYLKNRSNQKRIKRTAHELFTGTQPDMKKLYNYSSQCTYYTEGTSKSSLTEAKVVHIYFGINSKSYKILTRNNRIVTSLMPEMGIQWSHKAEMAQVIPCNKNLLQIKSGMVQKMPYHKNPPQRAEVRIQNLHYKNLHQIAEMMQNTSFYKNML